MLKRLSHLGPIAILLFCLTTLNLFAAPVFYYDCDKLLELITLSGKSQKQLAVRSIFGFGKSYTFVPTGPTRKIDEIKYFRVAQYNLYNFLTYSKLDDYGQPIPVPVDGEDTIKSLAGREALAKVMNDLDADIVAVEEISNRELLGSFSEKLLGNRYAPILIQGNSNRGINIGFLVKRDLPLKFEVHSFKERKSLYGYEMVAAFERDFPVIVVKRLDNDKPLFIMSGVHLKSKRTVMEGDKNASMRREIEVLEALDVLELVKRRYGKDLPVIVAGDFNNNLPISSEHRHFGLAGFKDALDVTSKPLAGDRYTHIYYGSHKTKYEQLDGILYDFPNVEEGAVITSGVYRYKDENGAELPVPKTYQERELNPSDHYPVYADFNFEFILNK